ncbi:MAG: hypothetical protein ABSB30_01675 [Terracidiphilus sp.]
MVTRLSRKLHPGEEIIYDSCLYDSGSGDDETIRNCGTAKCRGIMYSKKENRRRKEGDSFHQSF